MSKDTVTKPRQEKHKKYMLVRYGRMNEVGWFEHNEAHIPKLPARVVVKTNRGLELGSLVGQLSPYRAGQFRLTPAQTKEYFEKSGAEHSPEPVGKFVRYATADDISEEKHLQKITEEEIKCCKRFVKELNLPMKIIDAEHILGGERIIFYFMAENRVDFRQLVKKIAREYQTRIEMRQIGPRDEAKLLADYETCGQQCCCQRFLRILKPVNMRMAKMQKATLDPSKISGYCGRLKCCLRYEDKTYAELKKNLPKKNTIVMTEHGRGRVIDGQILTQLVVVECEDGRTVAVGVEDLEVVSEPQSKKKKQPPPKNEQEQDTGEKQRQ